MAGRRIGRTTNADMQATVSEVLIDVRNIVPRERHPRIFSTWEGLPDGGAIRLVNDHDPLPLYYQFAVEWAGGFHWEYVEQGPVEWAIDITSRARVVDARPTLAAGGEPFAEIMDAAAQVGDGEVLVVYAPFEPVPLEGVLGEQGFTYAAEDIGGGDWRVTFSRG